MLTPHPAPRTPHAVRTHVRCVDRLAAVGLACVIFALTSCTDTQAAENAIEHDLGAVPPHAEILEALSLPDTLRGHRFVGLQSSCGCVSPEILASGQALSADSVIPLTGPLTLRIAFRPRAASGDTTETARIRFLPKGSTTEQAQIFRFACQIRPSLSLLKNVASARIVAEAPIRKLAHALELRTSLHTKALRRLNSDLPKWLILAQTDKEEIDSVGVVIQDLSVVQDSEALLRLPFREGVSELINFRVHLQADTKLIPGSITQQVLRGSKLELPIRMQGGMVASGAGDLVVRQLHEVGGKTAKPDSLPAITLSVDTNPKSPTAGHLILKAVGFLRPGAFEAEVLVRPQGQGYQLALPVFFRVVGDN